MFPSNISHHQGNGKFQLNENLIKAEMKLQAGNYAHTNYQRVDNEESKAKEVWPGESTQKLWQPNAGKTKRCDKIIDLETNLLGKRRRVDQHDDVDSDD